MAGELEQDANREQPSPELWGVIEKLIWQGDFQGSFEDKEWVRHDVLTTGSRRSSATVPPDRLIVWELGKDGWEPLADDARRRRCRTSRSRTCTTRTSSGRSSGSSRCRPRFPAAL